MATPVKQAHFEDLESTQDEARRLAGEDPVLVTADRQSRGRGRSGAGWLNADRLVAASLAMRPGWEPAALPRITLVAGLAALDVVSGCGLKWPNDLVRGDAKLGGILTEHEGGVVVVGIGINLWWPESPEGMGALHESDPGAARGRDLGRSWARRLLDRLARGPEDWGRDEYRAACTTLGTEITWQPDGRGRAVDVAEDGALIVETEVGVIHLDSGAVTVIRGIDGPG